RQGAQRRPPGRGVAVPHQRHGHLGAGDRKSTRLNSSHVAISYAVFCLKKKKVQLLTAVLPARGLRLASALVACLARAATLGVVAVARQSQSRYGVVEVSGSALSVMELA